MQNWKSHVHPAIAQQAQRGSHVTQRALDATSVRGCSPGGPHLLGCAGSMSRYDERSCQCGILLQAELYGVLQEWFVMTAQCWQTRYGSDATVGDISFVSFSR